MKNKVNTTTKDTMTNELINVFETIRQYLASRNKVILLGFVIPYNIKLATNGKYKYYFFNIHMFY